MKVRVIKQPVDVVLGLEVNRSALLHDEQQNELEKPTWIEAVDKPELDTADWWAVGVDSF